MKSSFSYIVVLFFCSLLGCQKADLSGIANLRDNKIAIIGHGGMGFQSPQVNLPSNSFESITKAVEGYQANGVEVDVQISADGELFLYHDSRLQSLTDCAGCLYQHEADYLENCKYVSGFNTHLFNDQKLIRLETIIERFKDRVPKPMLFLDLKTSLDCPQTFDQNSFEDLFLESLTTIFEKYNCQDWVIIESGSVSFLQKLKSQIPEVKLNYFTIITSSAVQIAKENEFFGLTAHFDQASKEAILEAHHQGVFVTLGILIIRRDAIEMIELNPDFIYTDNIPLLQSILN